MGERVGEWGCWCEVRGGERVGEVRGGERVGEVRGGVVR